MAVVDIMLRTIFVAVPALSLVDPPITSGPTGRQIIPLRKSYSTSLQVSNQHLAFCLLPSLSAEMVNGVLPLAAIPSSISFSLIPETALTPASSSSSAPSTASVIAFSPPAIMAFTT